MICKGRHPRLQGVTVEISPEVVDAHPGSQEESVVETSSVRLASQELQQLNSVVESSVDTAAAASFSGGPRGFPCQASREPAALAASDPPYKHDSEDPPDSWLNQVLELTSWTNK